MTAIATRSVFNEMNWPRVGALSGSVSMHLIVLALLFTPPIAMRMLKPVAPETPIVVHVISPPPIEVETPLPAPPSVHHENHPRVTPHVVTIDHVEAPIAAPETPVSIPVESTPVQTGMPSAMQDVAPTALAYNTRTRVAYPRDSLLHGEHGTVVLRVLVGTDGLPQTVEIEKSSGWPRLDIAARDAVRRWTFQPGTRDGMPHSAWARVPIAFDLSTL
jgi:protein TonB